MANKVTIDVEARFVDSVTDESKAASKAVEGIGKEAEKAQKKVDNLSKKKARPIFDADDSKLLKKIRAAEAKASKLGRTKTKMVLTAMDKATTVIGKALNKGQAFARKTYKGTVAIADKASSGIEKAMGVGRKFAGKTWTAAVKIKDLATAPLRGIKNMLFSIKSLVLAITAGLAAKQFVMQPIGLADQYTSAKIGFQTLLGETEGQQMMNDLDAFAKATPFKASQVIGQTQRMLAMGWDAENIIDDMTTIGDAAAATGKGEQGLQQIVTALAQIKTKGKLSTEELNQLAEAGISAKKYIAEGLGYGSGDAGIAKMTKDLEDGAIASGKALEALLSGMQEYKGMMDKTANETVEGLWGQITDTFEINIFRKWGQGLQDGAKKSFGSVVTLLGEAEGALESFGDTLYEIGKSVSNWLAGKFEKAIERITDITGSFEFENASLKEKISMLWNGVIVDPLKEWWEGGGQQKTSETAGKIGTRMGEMLTKGLLALLGVTDIFSESGLDASGGASVAQSFAQGFVDAFDVSAITEKLKEAIANVWGALPAWAKLLIGGYGVAKGVGLVNGVVGGITTFAGNTAKLIGSTGSAIVNGSGLLGGLASAGYAVNGGAAAAAGMTGGTAALVGAGSIAGGLAMGAGAIHAGRTGYQAYQDYKAGDKQSAKANFIRSGGTMAGMATGAVAGAKLGGTIGSLGGPIGTVAGALIGGGIGTVAGWFGSDKIARNIEAAKYESEEMQAAIKNAETSSEELAATWEKAVWERSKEIFGDVKLSAAEIATLSKQIALGDKVQAMDEFASASSQADASLESLKKSVSALDRWNWKAGLGIALTAEDQKSYKEAIDTYITDAKNYLESKQYEFTASVKLLMDTGKGSTGAEIIKDNDAFYAGLKEKVDGYSKQLQDLMSSALENGKLTDEVKIKIDGENFTVDEQSAIEMLQEKISDIVNSINAAEEKAQLDLIEIKFKNSGISHESYEELQAGIDAYKETALGNLDEAQLNVLTNLNLRLDKAQTDEEKQKIQEQIDQTLESYGISVDELEANVDSFILNLAAENFSSEDLLGEDAMSKINELISSALKEGIEPAELTGEDVIRILGLENFDAEAAEILAKILNNLTIPDVETTVGVDITGEKNIQNTIDVLVEDFEIPEEQAATVALLLTGDKEILSKIDTTTLADELGVPPEVAETIITKLTGEKSIEGRVSVLGSELVESTEVWQTITVNLKAKVGKVVDKISGFFGGGSSKGKGKGFRGGIFGDNIPGFSDGGIVRGGSQLIEVAEEGSPEMVIPLSNQRRGRALKLWAQAGRMMDVPGFYRGGIVGGGNTEGFRFNPYNADEGSSQTVQVDVNGVAVEIHVHVSEGQSVAEAIREQTPEIAEAVAGILDDAFKTQFENTPTRGGAA